MKIINPGDGYSGTITHTDAWVQTRSQASYSCPTTGDGTEVALLTPSAITPQKAGNIIEIEWVVFGEETRVNGGFVVTRNNTILTDASDGSNNRWALTQNFQFDSDSATTPTFNVIRIRDNNSLAIASTYRLHCRAAEGTAGTYYLNRPVSSTGADSNETGVSTCKITEYIA